MRILVVHNRYQQLGGEDAVVQTEVELLRKFGNTVELYQRSNEEIENLSFFGKLSFLSDLIWSKRTYQEISDIIKRFKPDIIHAHNIFYVITPSLYKACHDHGIPVVQSQHNFRLLCSNGLFFRDGKPCEDCLKQKNLWLGVKHRCFKKSLLQSAMLVNVLTQHWRRQTWVKQIDALVMMSEFGRQKYIDAGFPANKIFVKSNTLVVDAMRSSTDEGYALYAGRLSEEKGPQLLLKAWENLPQIPLKILGDGPLMPMLKETIKQRSLKNIELLGFVDGQKSCEMISRARCVIVPSICYENFPRIIAEAFTYGVPVIASKIGSLPEVVEDGKTGLLFEANNSEDLASKISMFWKNNNLQNLMRDNLKVEFKNKFTSQTNYTKLMDIYETTISRFKKN